MKNETNKHDDIYEAIYAIVRQVPKGRVTTYGAVAAAVGLRSGARMVGYAMNLCGHIRPRVPAHRVVNSQGLLTGKHHFSPPEKMELLLKKEGVMVENDRVVDFRNLLWEPLKEIII